MASLVLGEGNLFVFQDNDGNLTLSAEVNKDIKLGLASGKLVKVVISNKEDDEIVEVVFSLKREHK